jgi:hypothetical protein
MIVVTMISRSGNGTGGVTNDSLKNAYNDLIRQNWQTFADELADVGASTLGQDGDYSTTDFIDGVHPAQASATNIIAPIISQAINHLP